MARLTKKFALLASLAIAAASSASQAATIFTDDFNYGGPDQLNWTGSNGWTVSDGTVDYLNTPNVHGISCYGGSGGCLDLDGSSFNSGVLSRTFNATAGQKLTLNAAFSGSQRSFEGPRNDVTFGIRDSNGNLVGQATTLSSLAWSVPFFEFSLENLLIGTSGVYSVFFQTSSNDNIGLILDNVSVTAVPLPAAAWLLLSGLGGVALFARRRRAEPVPA